MRLVGQFKIEELFHCSRVGSGEMQHANLAQIIAPTSMKELFSKVCLREALYTSTRLQEKDIKSPE